MYLYEVSDWNNKIILQNEKQYSYNEFEELCNEIPQNKYGTRNLYETSDYLISKYDFKHINYQAKKFVGAI